MAETFALISLPPAQVESGCLVQIHPLELNVNRVELTGQETFVGRDPRSTICLSDQSVSRKHSQINRTETGYVAKDMGSTNGTYVNDAPATSTELSSGDRIQFGVFVFKFFAADDVELRYHENVSTAMSRDGLTGTLNKRSFTDIIGKEFWQATRRTNPLSLSLILLDIDHFKAVNDTHGHLAGDEVLKEMTERINEVLGEHDVFARYGGEEFAILLPDVSTSEAANIAEQCRIAVAAQRFATSSGEVSVSISLGVANATELDCTDSVSDLIRAADKKLYKAKNAGRNRVCC
ncbi:UNVERIFIED_CONTAM: hypothetical protein GTU68_049174 [Idotea baltica]|nr:hypothetical protein [Idotea baltica]